MRIINVSALKLNPAKTMTQHDVFVHLKVKMEWNRFWHIIGVKGN